MDNSKLAKQMNALASRQVSVGAVVGYVLPRLKKLAMDSAAKPIGLAQAFDGITGKNFKASKPEIAKRIRTIAGPHLAKDASLEDVEKVLDMLDGHEIDGGDESVSKEQHNAMEAAAHGASTLDIPKKVGEEFAEADKGKSFDAAKDWMRAKGATDEEINSMFPPAAAADESEEEKKKREEEEKKAADAKTAKDAAEKADKDAKDKAAKDAAEMKDMVTKPAMDAAIKGAVEATAKSIRATEQGIRAALAEVKPWVGELPADMAFDSAADVHRHALKMLAVDGADKLHVDALLPVLKVQPKPGERTTQRESLAMDAAGDSDGFASRYPDAGRISVVA